MEIKAEPNSVGQSEFDLQDVQSFSSLTSKEQEASGMIACSRDDQGYVAQMRLGLKKAVAEQYAKDWMKAVDSAAERKR